MAQPPAKSTDRTEREKRLADALRQNLRRRKAQARARQEAGTGEPPAQKPKK
ncbi:MAG: hypothetical protein KF889_27095 [Alphaproteobacteria bacterium]|nr:hypothetical protein [Alphaproteobacteria bacterium]MCW5738659.1 hypothetical protein [Alphaproteobacteria bacterium]